MEKNKTQCSGPGAKLKYINEYVAKKKIHKYV